MCVCVGGWGATSRRSITLGKSSSSISSSQRVVAVNFREDNVSMEKLSIASDLRQNSNRNADDDDGYYVWLVSLGVCVSLHRMIIE